MDRNWNWFVLLSIAVVVLGVCVWILITRLAKHSHGQL
jgi:hypothetical protein